MSSKQPKLSSFQWVHDQAALLAALPFFESGNASPKGTVRGTIKSVDDPKELGRVQVLFDKDDIDTPQVTGAGEWAEPRPGDEVNISHWLDASPAFKGKQPEGLVDKRVSISVTDGEYQYAVVDGDVVFDRQNLTEKKGSKLQLPDNSTMTRMPVYEAGKLPPAVAENIGCTVIEKGGPYGDDWLCICLMRSGKYIWVRHVDLQHGHAGGNDILGYPDTAGAKPFPGMMPTVTDQTFPTSAGQCKQYSVYGSAARGNPYGAECQWFSPPMSDIQPNPIIEPFITNQTEAQDFIRNENGYAENIPGKITPIAGISIPSLGSIMPFPGFNINFDKMVQNILNLLKEQALAQLNQVTGGISNTIIQSTGINI